MRTRTHIVVLVITALVASVVGSLVAVASTAGTAHACSIAGPSAEAHPSVDLEPGQHIDIFGWGFNDIQLVEPQRQLVPPIEGEVSIPSQLCDFVVSPSSDLDVHWRGPNAALLGTVSGPDFKTSVVVPSAATPGPASITVGPVELVVLVGKPTEPPYPCPLTLQPDETAHHVCEPWPCPRQLAPDADHAPGFLPSCPEPCVDAAHTIDDGTAHEYRWDCPDPCSPFQTNSGAAQPDVSIWCPPPEPCPTYLVGGAVDGASWVSCPDPCGHTQTSARAAQPDVSIWCPPPEPCPDPPAIDGGNHATDEVSLPWCGPGPCRLVGGDALVCSEVQTSASGISVSSADTAPAVGVSPVEGVSGPASQPLEPAAGAPPVSQDFIRASASHAAADLVAAMSQRLTGIVGAVLASIFG
ncbi:hypothetical protein OAC41_01440 [Acidimicrobiales bacterium]|nr:hypothetical protein [Acidimicrobiales bacterium]